MKKLKISKSDLIAIDAKTKDCCTHWYHSKSKKLYSFNMKNNKWCEAKQQLYDFLSDKIEEIEKKLSKSKKNKIISGNNLGIEKTSQN